MYAVSEKGGFYNICHRRQRRARGAISFSISCQFKVAADVCCDFTLAFQIRTKGEDIRADFFVSSEDLVIDLDATGNRPGKVRLHIWRVGRRGTGATCHNSSKTKQTRIDRSPDLHSDTKVFPKMSINRRLLIVHLLFPRVLAGFASSEGTAWLEGVSIQPASSPSTGGAICARRFGATWRTPCRRLRSCAPSEVDFKMLTTWLKDVVLSSVDS